MEEENVLEKILKVIKEDESKINGWKSFDNPTRHHLMSLGYLGLCLVISSFVLWVTDRSPSSLVVIPILILILTGLLYCLFSVIYMLYDLTKAIKHLDPEINRAQNEYPIIKKQIKVLTDFNQKDLKLFSQWMSYKIQSENKLAILMATVGGFLSVLSSWALSIDSELKILIYTAKFISNPNMVFLISLLSGTMIAVAFILQSLTVRWSRYKFYVDTCLE